jgi:Undecaprenyl-phosphate galactose phosphotransferase WbaP
MPKESSMYLTSVISTFASPAQSLTKTTYHAWRSYLIILALDICSLTLSIGACVLTWGILRRQLVIPSTLDYLITIVLMFGIFTASDLYRASGVEPVKELRGAALAIGWTFLLLLCSAVFVKESATYSRGFIVLEWVYASILIPSTRLILRPILGQRSWFAKPVAILGAGRAALELIETLRRNPALALRPVAAFDDSPTEYGKVADVPVLCGIDGAPSYCRSVGIEYAIIAMPELSRRRLLDLIRGMRDSFSQVLLLSDLLGACSIWVETRDVGGMLGLEICDNLLRPSSLAAKRLLDLALVLAAAPIVLPLCGLIALMVKLHSPGRVFYSQRRAGRDGQVIHVWKFRTMLQNADELLEQFLAGNAELNAEWMATQKLKCDPRITSLGRFLRKTSLDELPQLWNVVKNEMSLVGPRPIPLAEIKKFGDSYPVYIRVSPGITGPWQVSGRSKLRYEERARLNEQYVRNWSVWLDLFILFRTIRVVLAFDDAY